MMRQHDDSTGVSVGLVSITGAGLVSCLGLNRQANWEAVMQGRSGIAPPTAAASPLSPHKRGGPAPHIRAATCDELPPAVV